MDLEQNIPMAISFIWFLLLLVHSSIASFYFRNGKGRKVLRASTIVSLVLTGGAILYGVLIQISVLSGQQQVAWALVIPGVIVTSIITTIGEGANALNEKTKVKSQVSTCHM